MGLKQSRLGLRSLDAYICNYKYIGHHFWLLHGYLLHNLDITDPVTEGVDDLNVLDVRDSIPGIADMFHVVLKTLIRLLLDGFEGFYSRWTLVRALKVSNEHGT
jgi:hypothetical protein